MVLKVLFWIFMLAVVLYAVPAVLLFLLQSKFLYCPVKNVFYNPNELGIDYEDVTMQTTDGLLLNGWYIPAPDSQFTILFCHGNGGNIMHRLDSINIFYKLGISCFIFDYRGYGKSQGKPTENGTYIDAMTAYQWLTEEKKIDPNNIIVLGKSLGGSIAAELASKVPAASIVLESAFTSYVDMGRKFYWYLPVKYFAKYRYATIDYLKNIKCPVMIIHSPEDNVVPYEFGRRLFVEANGPKEFVEISGSHNDGFLTSGDVYISAWRNWVNYLKKRREKSQQTGA